MSKVSRNLVLQRVQGAEIIGRGAGAAPFWLGVAKCRATLEKVAQQGGGDFSS